jgi:hypothetical protein
MSALDYWTEAPHNCVMDNANVMAFEEATKIIGGRIMVEEFLAYGIWLLNNSWDFESSK